MPAKQLLILAAEIGAGIAGWYFSRPENERRLIQAGAWRELEKLAMRFARYSSNLAAHAEKRYKETVSA
jgi:hypothetical protein